MLRGSCLCGAIRFTAVGPRSGIGFCHCSLCRKVSGVGASAKILVEFVNFTWISGEDHVVRYHRPSGFGVEFCRSCGSPAPDANAELGRCFIPVGLLDEAPDLPIADHSFVGSRAPWDVIGDTAPQFDGDGPPRPLT